MEGLQIDSRYIAHKLIQHLYEQGKINKATYYCVRATYPPVPAVPLAPAKKKKKRH